jgi:hypothetical protein
MDIKVYRRYRKYPSIPDYVEDSRMPYQLLAHVPVFVVTSQQLDAVVLLEDLELIQRHRHQRLLFLTDRRRVLAVDPQGYGYARYVCIMDRETARATLSKV